MQELTYNWSIPGEVTEASPEGLRNILGQIEAELYRSETYGQVLSNLENLPSEVGKQIQRMVKAVGREAIRLAFRRLVRRKPSGAIQTADQTGMDLTQSSHFPGASPPPVLPPPPPLNPHLETAIAPEAKTASNLTAAAIASTMVSVATAPMPTRVSPTVAKASSKTVQPQRRKRLTKKELAAQAAVEAWENRLRELGQEMRQARQAQSLSLHQLHFRTQIPIHQLEALETGYLERLPEDIYIRGFIRRIGDALGLDGMELADSIPMVDPIKAILPTWYRPHEKASVGGLQLSTMHLYVGYAAILAGGLTWISQQSAPKSPVVPAPSESPPATVTPPNQTNSPARAPAAKATKSTTTAPTAIAPPEVQPF